MMGDCTCKITPGTSAYGGSQIDSRGCEKHDTRNDVIESLRARLAEVQADRDQWREWCVVGKACIAELEGERDALQATITACEKEVSEVYRTLTNNRFSKMNTQAVYILDDVKKHGTGGWLSQLISYILTIRSTNTCEWMELLAEHINEIAEHIGDTDRVKFNGDGLSVVKGDK